MSVREKRPIGRLPPPPAQYSKDWADRFKQVIEQKFQHNDTPMLFGYTVSNYTETRTLNAGTATATDVANFVATFVQDLIDAGLIRKA